MRWEHEKYNGEMINKDNILDNFLKECGVNIRHYLKEKCLRM
jgi:hypothetical protein